LVNFFALRVFDMYAISSRLSSLTLLTWLWTASTGLAGGRRNVFLS
jgi:hypothetical protein